MMFKIELISEKSKKLTASNFTGGVIYSSN